MNSSQEVQNLNNKREPIFLLDTVDTRHLTKTLSFEELPVHQNYPPEQYRNQSSANNFNNLAEHSVHSPNHHRYFK